MNKIKLSVLFSLAATVMSIQLWVLPSKAETSTKQYQIVDGDAEISGSPAPLEANARNSWKEECNSWKKEIKDLNGKELLGISCNTPSCTNVRESVTQCVSQGTYKIKVEGALIPPAPELVKESPANEEVIVQEAPPAPVVEVVPDPRPGYIWESGYWGWSGHRHIWYPGHWIIERPGYVWIGNSWVHRGNGWSFSFGHWGRRH
jgi:hypothetical protein